MSKTTVTNAVWVEVASGAVSPNGSLYLQKGQDCALAQATSLPVTSIEDTPLLERMRYRENKVYFDVAADERIYARAEFNDCEITDTPAKNSAS